MFRKLLTLNEARETIYRHFAAEPTGFDAISILEAHNRVLAKDVVATLNIPPFDRSTVDGYAVKANDTFGAQESEPVKLKICGIANVGEMPRVLVRSKMAAEIVTGAPIPKGADAVVMLEQTDRETDDLLVNSAVAKGENIMRSGADIAKDEIILRKGQLLGAREIGVLAAVGTPKVKVYTTPRVAVLSTGAEVAELGAELQPGKIYDINAYALSAAVNESGGRPICLGVFPDDMNKIQQVLSKALISADIIVTSGGVSIGPKDIMPKALNLLGKPGVIVCGIAIKPGKPSTIAMIDGKLVFSLPGHPTSALLVFFLLVDPIIRSLSGRQAGKHTKLKAFASAKMFSAKGRRTFIMVSLRRDASNRLVAEPVQTGSSGAITTLSKADGFVEMSEDRQFIEANEDIVVQLFENGPP